MTVVIIIAVVFVTLAIFAAGAAGRHRLGSVAGAIETESRTGSWAISSTMVFVYVAFIIAVPLIFTIGNRDRSNAQVDGIRLTASDQAGRLLFAQRCAVCHTLAADNAVGKIGPNLDLLHAPKVLILRAIENGCLQKPLSTGASTSCLGHGTMPADVVQGRDAQDVAGFVAKVAGHT
jgi:hypothetical protein